MQTCKSLQYILTNWIRSPSPISLTYTVALHHILNIARKCTLHCWSNTKIHITSILHILMDVLYYLFYTNIHTCIYTLQGTNISPKNGILKMMFLFPRWDMLIPWRVYDIRLQLISLHLNLVIVCIICTCLLQDRCQQPWVLLDHFHWWLGEWLEDDGRFPAPKERTNGNFKIIKFICVSRKTIVGSIFQLYSITSNHLYGANRSYLLMVSKYARIHVPIDTHKKMMWFLEILLPYEGGDWFIRDQILSCWS